MDLTWEAFFMRYSPLARSLLRTLRVPADEVDDLVQDAVSAVLAAARRAEGGAGDGGPAFRDALHARNYFLRSLRNLAARRHRAPAPRLALDPETPARVDADVRRVEERRAALWRWLGELAPEDQELLRRRYEGRETLAEVARASGVPLSTLHRRERRALDALRRRFERWEEER